MSRLSLISILAVVLVAAGATAAGLLGCGWHCLALLPGPVGVAVLSFDSE